MSSKKKARSCREATQLEQIPNVGPAVANCLRRIGITCPSRLESRDAFELYESLCTHDQQCHDPCVLDVFMAAIDFMNGNPGKPWWKYTPQRKREVVARANMKSPRSAKKIGRRALLINGVLGLVAANATPSAAGFFRTGNSDTDSFRFTLLTDLHYADKPPGGTRYYRETLDKVSAARATINGFQPDFVVELGDVIDAAETVEMEKKYLSTICDSLDSLHGEKHYVLGNHCVYWLTKAEFLDVVKRQETYYSFDRHGYHFVILDACFRHDGEPYGRKNFEWTDSNIPQKELDWLQADLLASKQPAIVFLHQRLDVGGHYGVKNAADVRGILEKSGNVIAVFQGHNHKNDYSDINGIHYCTLQAMVEGSGTSSGAYANVTVDQQGNIRVAGFLRQKSYAWSQ